MTRYSLIPLGSFTGFHFRSTGDMQLMSPTGDMGEGAGGGVMSAGDGSGGVLVGSGAGITGEVLVGDGPVVTVGAGSLQVPSKSVLKVQTGEGGPQVEPTRAVTRQ